MTSASRAGIARRLFPLILVPALSGALILGLAGTASAATPAAASARSQPVLQYGESDYRVAYVQRALHVSPASGYFGSVTRAAVKRFQAAHGLPVTGVVASMTWRAIFRLGQVVHPVPAPHRISATFGQAGSRWSSRHTGLDLAAPTGTRVNSVAYGRIVSAGWAGAYGYRIIVRHGDGTQTWYCHLSRMARTSGTVAKGARIGSIGATGNVTGPHLHLEVRTGGVARNPYTWLRAHGIRP